jgi:hypothetical protein
MLGRPEPARNFKSWQHGSHIHIDGSSLAITYHHIATTVPVPVPVPVPSRLPVPRSLKLKWTNCSIRRRRTETDRSIRWKCKHMLAGLLSCYATKHQKLSSWLQSAQHNCTRIPVPVPGSGSSSWLKQSEQGEGESDLKADTSPVSAKTVLLSASQFLLPGHLHL